MSKDFPEMKYEPITQDEEPVIEVAPHEDSVDFLRKVYRDPRLPLHTRIKAADKARKHERSEQPARVMVEHDFAIRLDRAIERTNSVKVIEGRAVQVDDGGAGE
jgi:hypothetical protein